MRLLLVAFIIAATGFCAPRIEQVQSQPGFTYRHTSPNIAKPHSRRRIAQVQPQRSAPIPYHIETWAYDGGFQANKVPADDIARLVNYAEGSTKAVFDCKGRGCVSVLYFDAGIVYDGRGKCAPFSSDFMQASSEDWFVHYSGYHDADHRIGNNKFIAKCGDAIPRYVVNVSSPGVRAYYRAQLQKDDGYDAIFADDFFASIPVYSGGWLCQTPNPHRCAPGELEEYKEDQDVLRARVGFANALVHRNGQPFKLIFNGGSRQMYKGVRGFIGSVCESCPFSYVGGFNKSYVTILNSMAEASHNAGFLLLLSYGYGDQVTNRTVTIATDWLGYSPGHLVLFENARQTADRLNVWPEELLYPTRAIQSMKKGGSDLQVVPAVYRREFRACYYKKAPIGQCAAIVNASPDTIDISRDWLSQRYQHAATLPAGDALSGEDVAMGGAIPQTLEPHSAVLLLR